MSKFIILMKGSHAAWNSHSAEEKQRIMERYYAFIERLKKSHGFDGGSALKSGGYELRSGNSGVAVDGPFAESKEALNGYFVFEASSMAAALEIAKDCPALTHGETVELVEFTSH